MLVLKEARGLGFSPSSWVHVSDAFEELAGPVKNMNGPKKLGTSQVNE